MAMVAVATVAVVALGGSTMVSDAAGHGRS